MEVFLYASVSIIALAFVVLVYHVIQTLNSLQRTLKSAATTMDSLEVQMRGVTRETEELFKKTNVLVDDFSEKASKLDNLFEAAKDLGGSVSEINESVLVLKGKFVQGSEQLMNSINILSVASNFVEKWKDRKNDGKRESKYGK
ncbi:DUF948 domain-containing protein (plasmid) [Rossellomorea sp. AcN35-11]|nr:DUF948 domain-containing protein [Rossellomorea aquimaris]WJV32135.1 DUF948 domain-containing protein [Rossellomorea sp. AcN35-11]